MLDGVRRDGRAGIDASLVKRLVGAQFPQWRHLPVTPVEVDGWDNRTYHLGDDMSVRLPTHESYEPAVDKEHRWLSVLAPELPVPIPVPLAKGVPDEGYPFEWSIRPWLDGETASYERIDDLSAFAVSVAEFIRALQRIDASSGPQAGAHSFYRGASLVHYDDETRRSLDVLDGMVDTDRASAVWETALDATWHGDPVWFHGDIAHGNLLVKDGALAAVIDFGTAGVGDPACDLVIAWTLFYGASRQAFRYAVDQDEATWARARGWALWKALLTLAENVSTDNELASRNHRVIDEILADHDRTG
ncbi:aminoglycoside phosphotransferase family protein [Actinobacteria bacterium YIM 96077]|uniref:Acetyltransferase n=1 Tax=Phytoactinopolyspora halophila TaxID=1981511 RepID=A0A329R111_9ACTN|nr:aminoglycoside phosphotransferase family protein [Phytoactinopolyspora halophila]AYY13131.1 aminoglycoside phosphotransferase family protein [Actinobacteria bacterium YIM 96077]RAW17629.1 acetyltransferase [Phytoactinopolyspora halophila]